VFYCVANMPGAVPVTSTRALTNATLPYLTALAGRGWLGALRADPALALGLMTHAGDLFSSAVAQSHGYVATSPGDVLAVA
jgi:alanine dehydrogenase